MTVIRDPKTFSFNFDWPKDGDDNLKHEIEFIIKNNEFLANNKIKSHTCEEGGAHLRISFWYLLMNLRNK